MAGTPCSAPGARPGDAVDLAVEASPPEQAAVAAEAAGMKGATVVRPLAARLAGMDEHADVAVVGLGLIGSGALCALAETGAGTVVGIGPAEPDDRTTHRGPFASHYDSGRITRHLDPVREWAVLAARSIAGYASLETASGIAFHRPVGAALGELDDARAIAIRAVAEQLGVPLTVSDRGPDPRLAFPAGTTVLAEPAPAGHVDPRRMLAANLAVAQQRGATVLREPAVAVQRAEGRWSVSAASGRRVLADRVLVATGAHTDELPELAAAIPFEVRGETVVTATLGTDEQARLAGMPSVLARLRHDDYADLYAVPPTDYPDGTVRLKLGATLRTPRPLDTAEARRAWMAGDDHRGEHDALRALVEDLVPGIVAEAWETTPCMITDTPSGLPIVDHVGPNLVVAAGGNGYAAKSANAIGALAAGLLLAGRWVDDDLDAGAFAAPTSGAQG